MNESNKKERITQLNNIFSGMTLQHDSRKHDIIQAIELQSFFTMFIEETIEKDDVKSIMRDAKALTLQNWNEYSEQFLEDRLAIYDEALTLEEKIRLERSHLEGLRSSLSDPMVQVNRKQDLEILISRYESKLKQITSPEQTLEENDPVEPSTAISDKIRYLHELGVLQYLRKEGEPYTVNNRLAAFVAYMIGEKQISVQPYINAMFGGNTDKSPLNSEKKMEVVRSNLKKLGHNPSE